MTQAQAVPVEDAAELTLFIERRYHARHRQQLPHLVKLAAMIEDIHAGDAGLPAGLSLLLQRMGQEMEMHMRKEEMILFPAIRRGGMPGIEHPIAVMRADHEGHADDLSAIRSLTRDFTLPEGACSSWQTLYRDLAEFTEDLGEHMRLENEVLFPQFETAR
ncbi:hemerythrin domain-containing protein [Shimia sp.]|uniref:hemerythrin domain-containing protein n=1 Tax=Shimia sp. TaxID=1954381 RepID=UPI0035664BCF